MVELWVQVREILAGHDAGRRYEIQYLKKRADMSFKIELARQFGTTPDKMPHFDTREVRW